MALSHDVGSNGGPGHEIFFSMCTGGFVVCVAIVSVEVEQGISFQIESGFQRRRKMLCLRLSTDCVIFVN